MTSFPELGSPSSVPWTTTAAVWRALLALAVVFVMLATTGWTAVRGHAATGDARSRSLQSWLHGSIGGRPLPSPGSGPDVLARFFGSLTGAERDRLAERYPLVVGNLNGAPVSLRYRANRVALDRAREVEKHRMGESGLTPVGRREAGRRMHRFESLMGDGRQILAFDPGGAGRVAEVIGDLDRAERVSVVVPGVDTNVLTFEKTQRAYTAPVGMARSLHAAERKASAGTRTAVIAWDDYTTPAGVGMDAATGKLAAEGALRLRALVRALPGTSPVSLFCHSYGSVVCGVAVRDISPRVTDVAVAGSPGMRAEHVSELGTGARIWAMRNADDWIQDVPHLEVGGLGHGADPVSPGFGARLLSARGADGHGGYFEPGTTSLANFAAIGVGGSAEVVCAKGADACADGLV
ncbi:alpha/beta hydrolase [Streptomyces albireticuli]|nr:alpha/beta hydrolase [Streptomyces albireticuli]MCD9141910.1 alpha/beta hydrolase family protein [Streptomyces albireticuli]MCD9163146.1 alpha/beta hydrolase family protein [Streptomyces albireticuli]MCD9190084.1 alpha/beta hydrolase family protein [Streptomyces albireticuli]